MKNVFFFLGVLYSICGFSQKNQQAAITSLQQKIETTNGVQKLQLLDSLTSLILYEPSYNYDSIVRVTIDLAIKEQDYNIATEQTGDLIFYLINRRRQFEEGLQLFKTTLDQNWHITDSLSLAVLYGGGADSYLESGFVEESIQYYEIAERLYLKFNDSVAYGNIKGFKAYA